MKVAVLDLGTAFAKLFKPAAASPASSSPPYAAAPKSLLLPLPPAGAPSFSSLPSRSAALAPAGASTTAAAAGKPSGGGGNGSPRLAPASLAREAGGWAAAPSGNKQPLFHPLPDIGEEPGAPDAEPPQEAATAPRKGLAKGSADCCFQGKSENSLPAPFTKSVQEAIDSYTFISVSSLSSSGQTTPTDLNQSWSGIQSCTSGPSTERSSVYSWRDDEFDKANTERVHRLFWAVDEMLFEGKVSSQTESLKPECKDWTNRSLHLRILGRQLLFPNDEGFQHYQSRNATSVYSRSVPTLCEITSSMKGLCISGSKLIPAASPVHQAINTDLPGLSSAESSVYSFLQEEIYDAEGKIEEYLAFDKEHDDENVELKKSQLTQKRTRHGFPPVSPDACTKDAVAAEVFDHVWKNVIGVLEELVRKYWESAITENDKHMEKLKAVGNKLPHLPFPRITLDASSVPPSRGSEARGTSFGLHFGPSQIHRLTSNVCSDLNGVMTIQAKPLQQRLSGLADKTQAEQEDKLPGASSFSVTSARNRTGRLTDSSGLSSSRVLQGSCRKTLGHRRLPSITADSLRSRTPNVYSDEVLRGTKLCTALDRLPSPLPPPPWNKLPPISSQVVEQYLSVPGFRQGCHRGRYPHSRISSAVPDGAEQRPRREQSVIREQCSRPNTTHTFRSDTPHKRSLTSMDFANHTWTSQVVLTDLYAALSNPEGFPRQFTIPSKHFCPQRAHHVKKGKEQPGKWNDVCRGSKTDKDRTETTVLYAGGDDNAALDSHIVPSSMPNHFRENHLSLEGDFNWHHNLQQKKTQRLALDGDLQCSVYDLPLGAVKKNHYCSSVA